MAIIDTTNTIDTSIYLKAKLANNMVGENWYLQNLQDKRNQDWYYRYNVIGIEEELNKQIDYTPELPCYTPVEAVIQTVKDDRHKPLGDDWASLSFQDLQHPNAIGSRYRFDFTHEGEGMQDLSTMTEEEKYYNTSIWLATNKSSINAGNALVVRRCNTSIALIGSPNRSYKNITEVRYEPGVLENELKLINIYYNQTTVVPQAEWYLTMQLNYFTNFITINDRLILGGVDLQDESNNTIFKVKAIVKANSNRTFSEFGTHDIKNIPLIILGLDRDLADSDDDFEKRIAVQSPIYPVPVVDERDLTPPDEFIITTKKDTEDQEDKIIEEQNEVILLGQSVTKTLVLANVDNEKASNFEFAYELEGVAEEDYNKYFNFKTSVNEDGYLNSFTIANLKQYSYGRLNVFCVTSTPNSKRENGVAEKTIQKVYTFELGGFY